jgi:DNA modification methylase
MTKLNKFIIGNSFDILPHIGDNTYDVILTDVPYDLSSSSKHELHDEFLRICRGVVIVFSPWKNPWILPCDQKLYWVKPISTKNTSRRYSNFVEEVFIYGENVWNTNLHWSNYVNVLVDRVDDVTEHAYRKPPTLIERLIKLHSNVDDFVLDPFAGSGVVHDACVKLQRNSTSIELNEKYAKD